MYVNFFKKIIVGKPIIVGTYQYNFLDVVPYEEGLEDTPAFIVNVTTKNPFQSYCKQKMLDDIQQIISDKIRLIGLDNKLSFGLDLEFNGMEPLSVFVSQEDREKLIFQLNKKLKFFKYKNQKKQEVVFEVEFSASENFVNVERSDEIYFSFDLNLRRFEVDGQPIPVIQKYGNRFNDFATMIQQEICSNDDTFRVEIENIIYVVIEPSMQLTSTEMYYVANFFVRKINGVEVEQKFGVDPADYPEFI